MSGAERKRRFRERQRLGLAVVPVEVDVCALAELLVAVGELHPRRVESFAEVCAAASRYLAGQIAEYGQKRNASLGRGRGRW